FPYTTLFRSGRGEAELDTVRVGAAVPDRAHDLPLEVVTGARGRTKRRRRVVIHVHAAQALRGRVTVVAAVRAGIAGVGHLDHVVVASLRVGGVHDAHAAVDLVHARAEPAQDVHEEGRHDEARLVAAPLRAAGDAAVRVARHLAPRDPRAGRVRVPARAAGAVLAGGEGAWRHREVRLHPGRERHSLP